MPNKKLTILLEYGEEEIRFMIQTDTEWMDFIYLCIYFESV